MDSWTRYNDTLIRTTDLQISLDFSQMGVEPGHVAVMSKPCEAAYAAMQALEGGAISNPDEGRQVGHYWLRNASLAPKESPEIATYIKECIAAIESFAAAVHNGEVKPASSERFTQVLVIGIGGSALGPQLVADALGAQDDKMGIAFLDNTDPDGFERVLSSLPLPETLTVVISKSGGTKETYNGMCAAQAAYEAASLTFSQHAVAVTGQGSKLDKVAVDGGWVKRFDMTDWVGGRTSVTSVVGLLPMALQGLNLTEFLNGAALMDAHTRKTDTSNNPAMMMALMWHAAGDGRGKKDMVILPYKDRLMLMAKYLQQLVMESLGKEHDLKGKVVEQGIAVYGNKGSTDQHAYVQQLRDGVDNFFVTFIEVRQSHSDVRVMNDMASDYLQGFLRGTRSALADKKRPSMTLSLPTVDATRLGAVIALFERAVGYYASLVGINAYHQPGVEAGKVAAEAFIRLLNASREVLQANVGNAQTAADWAAALTLKDDVSVENVYHALQHLANNDPGVEVIWGIRPAHDTFALQPA